ncbi:MAG: murein hydrolase activator EnvC family protein [Fimbriimonadaceae bacterium]
MRSIAVLSAIALVLVVLAQSSLENRQQDVESQIERVESQLEETRAEAADAKRDFDVVDKEFSEVQSGIAIARGRIEEARAEQALLGAELKVRMQEIEEQKVVITNRLREMCTKSEAPAAMLLFEADSVSDFAARQAMLKRVARKDREMFQVLEQKRRDIIAEQERNDILIEEIRVLDRTLQEKSAELQVLLAEKQRIMDEIQADADAYARQLDQLENESEAIASMIKAYQAGEQGVPGPFTGSFINPTPGARVSSNYGMRIHPIARTRRMHTGIDLAAPTGTPIVASAAGKVIFAGWKRGYGNTVIVDHGGGMSTLYAHCSSITVGNGQIVNMGQTIARVGSTGYSTGPHLHFEIRQGGRHQNPRNYVGF